MTGNHHDLDYGGSSQEQLREAMKALQVLDMSSHDVDALVARVQEAFDYGMTIDQKDGKILVESLKTCLYLQEKLEANDLTLHKLRKLLGMEPSSERQPRLPEAKSPDSEGRSDGKDPKPKPSTKSGHGKRGAKDFKDVTTQHHKLEGLSKGDPCPSCLTGKLYKYEPAILIRISGHAPYEVTKHVSERRRCNACGEFFTAALPSEVIADGEPGQRFGYSACSLMVINKYLAGSPFYRQQSLADILGSPVSASTIFDQCEKVADSGFLIYKAMAQEAANMPRLHIDDTTHRIREAEPMVKNGRTRTGVYTSGLIGVDEQRTVVVFKTNIGHAGELLDEILELRSPDRGPPLVMSDALASNHVTKKVIEVCLCNAHGRREFFELKTHDPKIIDHILALYGKVFENERHCKTEKLDDKARLCYHREHSLTVMEELKEYARQLIEEEKIFEPNSLFGKAYQYLDNNWQGLTAFCRLLGAALDNNLMERTLRIVVLGRKNAYFYKTEAGAAISDVLTSILATCKLNEVNPLHYLTAIQRYKNQVKENPLAWLPWNFRESLL